MAAIRSVVQRYDLVAVQELSQKPSAPFACGENTESVICALRPGEGSHSAVASPRIGDEQYAVIVRNAAAEVLDSGATYPDSSHVHSRPPHAFDATVKSGRKRWRLVVATTHTSPKAATEEIHNFPKVLSWMKRRFGGSGSTHYVLAGDFNGDGGYFKDTKEWPGSKLGPNWQGYSLLTGNGMDTTVASNDNTYDRIIADDALARKASSPSVFRLEDVDLSEVRAEGCRDGYVPASLCSGPLDKVTWADTASSVKTALAKELSDHHPVEVCLRV